MINGLFVFLGAGTGGVLRYCISTGIYTLLGRKFPYGTLFVNASGCLLVGFLSIIIAQKNASVAPVLRGLFLYGFLGGYTTFSTFSIETFILFEKGQWLGASLNIVLNLFIGLLLTYIGVMTAKQL